MKDIETKVSPEFNATKIILKFVKLRQRYVCHQVGEEGEEEAAARGGRGGQGERRNLSNLRRNIQSLSARNLTPDC